MTSAETRSLRRGSASSALRQRPGLESAAHTQRLKRDFRPCVLPSPLSWLAVCDIGSDSPGRALLESVAAAEAA
jgi:hypothetical protein